MNDSDKALEHLQVIRGLMEKATVYRAVSVPTALMSGGLALVVSGILFALDTSVTTANMVSAWLGAFLVVNLFHHGLIWKTAQKEGDLYLSSGLRMALKALLPPIFVGGILGLSLGYGPAADSVGTSLVWVTFYGLALMATNGFSPRSLRVLGLAFTLAGSLLLALHWLDSGSLVSSMSPQRVSALIMGVTFGLFHLIYAGFARAHQHGASA